MKVVRSKVNRNAGGDNNNNNKVLVNAIKMHMYRSDQFNRIDDSKFHVKDTTKRKLANIARKKKINRINFERRKKQHRKYKKKEEIISHDSFPAGDTVNLGQIDTTEQIKGDE
jgi:acid phosphatase class B